MSLTAPTLADPITPSDAWRQAAARETPFGQYIGEKLLGGLEATRPVQALEQAMLPPRSNIPDEYGFVAPPGPSPVLDKTAWEASPHFRPGIEYDAGMTEARAEALATQKDRLDWNNSLIARYQGGYLGEAAGFVAGLAPGVADPTNYIPLLGPAAKAAMVARLGVIGGNVALHGAEAAANTALFEPLTASHAATFGQSYGWQDAAADVALGALAGSVGGAIHGGLSLSAAKAEYRGSLREAATRTRLETVLAAADATSLAAEQNDRGLPVDVAPILAGRLPEARPRELPPGLDVYHATDAADFDAFDPGRRGAVYFSESPDRAEVGATMGARDRNASVGEGARVIPARVTSPVAYRDAPPGFGFPESLRGADGYYDEARAAEIKAKAETFDAPGLTDAERDYTRKYLLGYLEHRYDAVTGEPQKLVNEIRHFHPPDDKEFEHGIGAHEKGYNDGSYTVLGAKTPPETIRNALRSLGYEASLVADETSKGGKHAVAVFPKKPGGPVEAVVSRLAPFRGEPSFATAAPEPPHPSVAEAARRVGKAEADPLATFKADAGLEGYQAPLPGHEPKPEPVPGEPAKPARPERPPTREEKAAALAALPPELAEIEAMRREGSFTPGDEATLAAGEAEAQRAEGYATAWTTLAGCVARAVVA